MNILLWIIQVLLALLFLFAGIAKFVMPLDQIPLPALFLKFIGVCEVLGGLGLILPGLLRRQRYLTPLAAIGLTIIMIGAVVFTITHGGIKEAISPLVFGLLCAFVAYGRANWRTTER